MKNSSLDHATIEVIPMVPFLRIGSGALLLLTALSGCSGSRINNQTDPAIYSDRNFYYQQSVVPPGKTIPYLTPYGTPANFGTGSDYGRSLRPDAISDYGPLFTP
jgi:hypothetical protein